VVQNLPARGRKTKKNKEMALVGNAKFKSALNFKRLRTDS
jgi:hypothetical protein